MYTAAEAQAEQSTYGGSRSYGKTLETEFCPILSQSVFPAGSTDFAAVTRDTYSLRLHEAICQLTIGRGTPREPWRTVQGKKRLKIPAFPAWRRPVRLRLK